MMSNRTFPSRVAARSILIAVVMLGAQVAMPDPTPAPSAAPEHHHMADMPGMAGMPAMNEAATTTGSTDAHAAHHQMMANNEITRSVVTYPVPQVTLVRQDGVGVSLDQEVNDGRPVVMNFIYTTCTTICPLTSQTFRALQDRLGPERAKVHLVSISIDPEQDTPARLTEYAARFHADSEWQHYTGTLAASIQAQRAFGVYRGDKMNHTPVTLLRAAPGEAWIRLDGFATADDLLAELHNFRVLH
jgi:protein SCO1